MNDIQSAIIKTAITSFMTVIGQGGNFARVVARIKLINEQMPDNTGKEKRAQFFKDCEIIFDDLVIPFSEAFLRGVLELGIIYIKGRIEKNGQ